MKKLVSRVFSPHREVIGGKTRVKLSQKVENNEQRITFHLGWQRGRIRAVVLKQWVFELATKPELLHSMGSTASWFLNSQHGKRCLAQSVISRYLGMSSEWTRVRRCRGRAFKQREQYKWITTMKSYRFNLAEGNEHRGRWN